MPKFRLPTLTMTTDIVIFSIRGERLEILLIQRGNPPFQGSWAASGRPRRARRRPRCLRPPRIGGRDWRYRPEARAAPRLRSTATGTRGAGSSPSPITP